MLEEQVRRDSMLDLILTNKEGWVGNVKFEGIFYCQDHEMVQFWILRGEGKKYKELTALVFRRADL